MCSHKHEICAAFAFNIRKCLWVYLMTRLLVSTLFTIQQTNINRMVHRWYRVFHFLDSFLVVDVKQNNSHYKYYCYNTKRIRE